MSSIQPQEAASVSGAVNESETIYSNLSSDEFGDKIFEVQAETRAHVAELKKTKESEELEAGEVLAMLDAASDYFDPARSVLAEVRRRQMLRKDKPCFQAGVTAVALLKRDLGLVDKMRKECEPKEPEVKPEKKDDVLGKGGNDGEAYDDRDTVRSGEPADRVQEQGPPPPPSIISVRARSGSAQSQDYNSVDGNPRAEKDIEMEHAEEDVGLLQGAGSLESGQSSHEDRRSKRSQKPTVRYEAGPASAKRSKSTAAAAAAAGTAPKATSPDDTSGARALLMEGHGGANANDTVYGGGEDVVKKEMTYADWRPTDNRKYGDRYLLGRQDPKGIMRLGGGGQGTHAKPRADHPRLQTQIGDLEVCCYNDIWQGFVAPQFAGSDGFVAWLPSSVENDGAEMALFMRRTRTSFSPDTKSEGRRLGWEYCGVYKFGGDADIEAIHESALSFSPASKGKIAKKILTSSKSKDGYGRHELDHWRVRLGMEVSKDRSPPGPRWMIEKRAPTEEERKERQYPLAARARALGYKASMTDEALSNLIVHLNENYPLLPIEFVRYDEAVYDYVKKGVTGMNAQGKPRGPGEDAARASDWYAFLDTLSI